MKIQLPNISLVIDEILPIKSVYDGTEKSIGDWVIDHRHYIEKNKALLNCQSEINDLNILTILFVNLLMRSVKGETGARLEKAFKKQIRSKADLNETLFKKVLNTTHYRWKNDGVQVMKNIVEYFENTNWNWINYFKMAEKFSNDNFIQDDLLKIKNIKYKVRDLAISNFSENYIANDLHIVRVSTRLGLLNYGFDLISDSNIEMGNNPNNEKNYLFLHKLFLKLSRMTNGSYSLADIDRVFWHFGRTICNSKPHCSKCPINKICLTGQSTNYGV